MPTAVTAETLAEARRRARAVCEDAVPEPGRCDDLLLVLSELVGNACRHGGPPVTYEIDADGPDLMVSVEDGDPTPPSGAPGHVAPGAESGRGLFLVAAVSKVWGWRPTDRGKLVWACV